ncbi:MAG: DegT/DnrJ/EryC1/StrS family aminotransferase [Phycisphaerae bacterium]|nr:DegT/DnrJ/EryC1/StrS family aminotransferase [Phycisphaerae bacterium]
MATLDEKQSVTAEAVPAHFNSGAVSEKLAIHGGQRVFDHSHGRPEPKIGVDEFFAIAQRFGFRPEAMARLRAAVSNSDLLAGGPNLGKYLTTVPKPSAGSQFEALAREYFGSPHALGVSSGTGALHAAMVAVGAAPGREVVVPGLGFIATAMAAVLAGATPVFCDVDDSLQMDPKKLEACINPQTVAVVPTHHWGGVADMDPIVEIARKHKLAIIEDCAQSPGATYKGQRVGTTGDIGCFSISAYKIIGAGEGGLVLAKDQRLFERVNQVAESGGLWRPDRFAPPRYDGELFAGANYRMSELEAAADVVQLRKLDEIIRRYRQAYHRILGQLIRVREVKPQRQNDRDGMIGYMLRLFPQTDELRVKLVAALQAEGVPANSRGPSAGPDWHLCGDMWPLRPYLHPAGSHERCKVATDLYHREIHVGIDQWWTVEDCDAVAKGINKVLSVYGTLEETSRVGW